MKTLLIKNDLLGGTFATPIKVSETTQKKRETADAKQLDTYKTVIPQIVKGQEEREARILKNLEALSKRWKVPLTIEPDFVGEVGGEVDGMKGVFNIKKSADRIKQFSKNFDRAKSKKDPEGRKSSKDIEKKFVAKPNTWDYYLKQTKFKYDIEEKAVSENKKTISIYINYYNKIPFGFDWLSRIKNSRVKEPVEGIEGKFRFVNNRYVMKFGKELFEAMEVEDHPDEYYYSSAGRTVEDAKADFQALVNMGKIKRYNGDGTGKWGGFEGFSGSAGNHCLDYYIEKHRHLTQTSDGDSYNSVWNNYIERAVLYQSTYQIKIGALLSKTFLYRDTPLSVYYALDKDQKLILGGLQGKVFANSQFKPYVALQLYQYFGNTINKGIYDPFSGWGGRLLGAMAGNFNYTSADTNVDMKPDFDRMFYDLRNLYSSNITMNWGDSSKVDLSKVDYDFVFSSPPYIAKVPTTQLDKPVKQIEDYDNMPFYNTPRDFYESLICPVIAQCWNYLPNNKWFCLNIPQHNYESLSENYDLPRPKLRFIYPKKDRAGTGKTIIDKETGKEVSAEGTAEEYIYCWNKDKDTDKAFREKIMVFLKDNTKEKFLQSKVKDFIKKGTVEGKNKFIIRKKKGQEGTETQDTEKLINVSKKPLIADATKYSPASITKIIPPSKPTASGKPIPKSYIDVMINPTSTPKDRGKALRESGIYSKTDLSKLVDFMNQQKETENRKKAQEGKDYKGDFLEPKPLDLESEETITPVILGEGFYTHTQLTKIRRKRT